VRTAMVRVVDVVVPKAAAGRVEGEEDVGTVFPDQAGHIAARFEGVLERPSG